MVVDRSGFSVACGGHSSLQAVDAGRDAWMLRVYHLKNERLSH